ncbi:IclR family transcriptional regulator C-terminal domain-containing protein [Paenarthrobacter sp. RAF9]
MANSASGDSVVDRVVRVIEAFPEGVTTLQLNLAVLDGWEALFVERLSRRGSVANRAQIAGRMPVHISSAGLALMSHQSRELQAEYLRQFQDPAGEVSADVVRHLLAEAAQQGYAQLAGVVDPDTWGIAVPVMNGKRKTVAALGVVVPLAEMRLQALVPALQTAARGIGRQLA